MSSKTNYTLDLIFIAMSSTLVVLLFMAAFFYKQLAKTVSIVLWGVEMTVYLWLAALSVVLLMALVVAVYRVLLLKQQYHQAEADTFKTQAEALALLHVVTVAKPGHSVVTSQIQHPFMLTDVKISQIYTPALPDKKVNLLPAESVDDLTATIKMGQNWLKEFLFDELGQLKVFHVKTDGPTGVGKTHLMLHLMWLLQQPHPAAEYWLSDPKFEGESSGWPFTPFITDFDQVAEGAEYLYQHVVTARKHAKREGHAPLHPAFLLFDEADGCFDECGDKFSKPVRRIVKEGRSGWTHCFMAGQSALAKDVGFSGAFFRNMARFVMGNEAIAFTRNAQFSFWEKGHRDLLSRQLSYLQEHGRRSVLVVPPSGLGLPFVGEVPVLPRPDFRQLAVFPQTTKMVDLVTTDNQTVNLPVVDNTVLGQIKAFLQTNPRAGRETIKKGLDLRIDTNLLTDLVRQAKSETTVSV